jgi:hypothetical protein
MCDVVDISWQRPFIYSVQDTRADVAWIFCRPQVWRSFIQNLRHKKAQAEYPGFLALVCGAEGYQIELVSH